ncbi:MAG: hypothetical protein ACXABC_16185, partial [Candidatus Thorarchaeota archaeon]
MQERKTAWRDHKLRTKYTPMIVVICIMLLLPVLTIRTPNLQSVSTTSGNHFPSYSEVTRDVEFTLGKSFERTNNVNHPDFADRSASNIVDEIDDFLPEGLERVTDVDVYYTDVSLSITQLHIIEDREFLGPGSMFLNILLNDDNDNRNYRFDNGGSYYVANDGTYLDVDIS